jgi:hypothetical protein
MGGASKDRVALNLSPLLSAEVRLLAKADAGRGRIASAIRVRGSLRGFLCLPDSRMEPLTPALSPQGRGEGVKWIRGDNS